MHCWIFSFILSFIILFFIFPFCLPTFFFVLYFILYFMLLFWGKYVLRLFYFFHIFFDFFFCCEPKLKTLLKNKKKMFLNVPPNQIKQNISCKKNKFVKKISYVWLVNIMLTHIPIYTYILHSSRKQPQDFNYHVSLYFHPFDCKKGCFRPSLRNFTLLTLFLFFIICSECPSLSTEFIDAERSTFGCFTSYELCWSASSKLNLWLTIFGWMLISVAFWMLSFNLKVFHMGCLIWRESFKIWS